MFVFRLDAARGRTLCLRRSLDSFPGPLKASRSPRKLESGPSYHSPVLAGAPGWDLGNQPASWIIITVVVCSAPGCEWWPRCRQKFGSSMRSAGRFVSGVDCVLDILRDRAGRAGLESTLFHVFTALCHSCWMVVSSRGFPYTCDGWVYLGQFISYACSCQPIFLRVSMSSVDVLALESFKFVVGTGKRLLTAPAGRLPQSPWIDRRLPCHKAPSSTVPRPSLSWSSSSSQVTRYGRYRVNLHAWPTRSFLAFSFPTSTSLCAIPSARVEHDSDRTGLIPDQPRQSTRNSVGQALSHHRRPFSVSVRVLYFALCCG